MENPILKFVERKIDRAKSVRDIATIFSLLWEGMDDAGTMDDNGSGRVTGGNDGRNTGANDPGGNGSLPSESFRESRSGGKIAIGAEMSLIHAGGESAGKYEVWEASDLIPSHDALNGFTKSEIYPTDVQERPYHSDQGEQEKVKANALRLDPRFLITDNPDAVNGPPIVTREGVVLGGNSRTMSIQLAMAQGGERAQKYKDTLKAKASFFGINSDTIDKFQSPVLVRVMDGSEGQDKADLARLVRVFNQAFMQGLDVKAEGVSKARLLSAESMAIAGSGLEEHDSLASYLSSAASKKLVDALQADGVIEQQQYDKLVHRGTGLLTEDGKRLIINVLRGKAIDDFDLLNALSPSMQNKLDKIIGPLARIKAKGGAWDITTQLKQALWHHVHYANSKAQSPNEYMNQLTFDAEVNAEKKDPRVRELFYLMARSKSTEIATAWSTFAKRAEVIPRGVSMLPGMGAATAGATPGVAFRESFKIEDEDIVTEAAHVWRSWANPEEVRHEIQGADNLDTIIYWFSRLFGLPDNLDKQIKVAKALEGALNALERGGLSETDKAIALDIVVQARNIQYDVAIKGSDLDERAKAVWEQAKENRGEAVYVELKDRGRALLSEFQADYALVDELAKKRDALATEIINSKATLSKWQKDTDFFKRLESARIELARQSAANKRLNELHLEFCEKYDGIESNAPKEFLEDVEAAEQAWKEEFETLHEMMRKEAPVTYPQIEAKETEYRELCKEVSTKAKEPGNRILNEVLAQSSISEDEAKAWVRDNVFVTKAAKQKLARMLKNKPNGYTVDNILNDCEEFYRLTNGKLMPITIDIDGGKRANANTAIINLGQGVCKRTMFHEMGHHVEFFARDVIYKAAEAFRDSKAKGFELKKLSKITGNSNYKKDEVAYEGDYYHPYIGKVYGRDSATEVVSMGLELFANPAKLTEIALKHQDHVAFAAGIAMYEPKLAQEIAAFKVEEERVNEVKLKEAWKIELARIQRIAKKKLEVDKDTFEAITEGNIEIDGVKVHGEQIIYPDSMHEMGYNRTIAQTSGKALHAGYLLALVQEDWDVGTRKAKELGLFDASDVLKCIYANEPPKRFTPDMKIPDLGGK